MKKINPIFFLIIAISLFSCKEDEEFTSGLMEKNLKSLVQTYTLDLDLVNDFVWFQSDAKCEFYFKPNKFSHNGVTVNGTIQVDMIEIFDKGTMAITGKHTMTADEILISGGEFFIRAYQGEKKLDYDANYYVDVPSYLSGEYSKDMQIFAGGENLNSTQDWVSVPNIGDTSGVFDEDSIGSYSLNLSDFQWFNCDRFLNDPRPSIALDIKTPSQFDYQNSSIYLAIKGEKSALGNAVVGTYPMGLEVHLIFVAEVENQFLYQVLSGIVGEEEYKFDRNKMKSASSEEFKDVVNGLD